jgi:hypothetical protein
MFPRKNHRHTGMHLRPGGTRTGRLSRGVECGGGAQWVEKPRTGPIPSKYRSRGCELQRIGFFFQAPGVSYTLHYARGIHVKRDQSSLAGDANRFLTTRWSVVLVSAQSQAPGSKEAFADLCKLYWYPLYAFIRYRGYSPEDAQDLVQGFFLHLVEHKTLRRVDRSKGKFRSFLLASLQNFLSDEADRARCLKRGGGAEFVHFDLEGCEDR